MEKTTTKKWLRVSVILYIVILTMVAVASFAWFLFDDTASLQTSNNMVITSGNKLEIALLDATDNPGEFGSLIQYQTDIDFSYPDITGTITPNGIEFYYPQALDEHDAPLYSEPDTFKKLNLDNEEECAPYLIKVRVRFKTTVPMDVYLSSDSFVQGMSKVLNGADAGNLSPYGNFSRDVIAGAARVAFLEEKTTGGLELKNIWIPNGNYQISYISEKEATDSQKNGVTMRDEYGKLAIFNQEGLLENINEIGGLARFETASGVVLDMAPFGTLEYMENDPSRPGMGKYLDRLVTLGKEYLAKKNEQSVPMINNAAPLLSFSADEIRASNGVAEKDLTIYIWIEGTDREADKATVGGKMKYKFDFIGIQKEECEYAIENIQYDATAGTLTYAVGEGVSNPVMQYSEDGINWKTYSNKLELSAETKIFYVRIAETNNAKASYWKQFTVTK